MFIHLLRQRKLWKSVELNSMVGAWSEGVEGHYEKKVIYSEA